MPTFPYLLLYFRIAYFLSPYFRIKYGWIRMVGVSDTCFRYQLSLFEGNNLKVYYYICFYGLPHSLLKLYSKQPQIWLEQEGWG